MAIVPLRVSREHCKWRALLGLISSTKTPTPLYGATVAGTLHCTRLVTTTKHVESDQAEPLKVYHKDTLPWIIFLCNYFVTLRIKKHLLEGREMVDIPTQSSNRLQWHQLTIVSPIFYLLVFLRGLDVWLDSFWCLNWLKMLSSNQISKTQTSKLSLLFRRGWHSK